MTAFPKPIKKVIEKKRVPRKSKSERSKLIDACDKEMSRIVLERDGHKCVMCGSTKQVGNGHVFPKGRGASSLRWDWNNCFAQCWSHNYGHVRDQYPYHTWYQEKFGMEAFHELRRRWKQTANFSIVELRELLENLKQN